MDESAPLKPWAEEALRAIRQVQASFNDPGTWYNQPRSWGDVLRCFVGLHRVAQSGWIWGSLFSRCTCGAYRIGAGGWHREQFWSGPRKAKQDA